MTNPFLFNIAQLLRGPDANGVPQQRTQTGPAPERVGVHMVGIPQGRDVTVDATLTPLGGAILVDADVSGTLDGECSRCLTPIHPHLDLHVSKIYALEPDFITGDPADEEDEGSGDETPLVEGDEINILQAVIDEAGLTLPFNPVCDGKCEVDTPEGVTTGISGEEIDERWAGLEKFL